MSAADRVLLVNGPNLDMLGRREPQIYGRESLAEIEAACRAKAAALGLELDFRQSNSEGELIGWIHRARDDCAGIIINPAALTHTSLALLDALLLTELPVIEVHLSNYHKRESFRQFSYVSQIARGIICGLGSHGYLLALAAMARILGRGDAP